MTETKGSRSSGNAVLVAIFATALFVVFTAFRSSDLLKLPQLVGNLGGGPLFGGEGVVASVVGAVVSALILFAWFGMGGFVFRYLKAGVDSDPHGFGFLQKIAVGSIITSLIWFFLGLAGLYSTMVAIILTTLCVIEGGLGLIQKNNANVERQASEKVTGLTKVLVLIIAIPVLLAFIASLAPPIAKDTLLYHLSVPKAFIAQGGNAFVEGNIASYLALGTEMHSVWAMLLGGLVSARAAEAAAGATVFLFFPLLLMAVYGWARQWASRVWSLVAVGMVATIPTAFHVASSGYIDLSLALYVVLAVYSISRWWRTLETGPLILAAVFLGGALAVKLTAVFVVAALALVVLLKARRAENAGKTAIAGFAALILAAAIASPWYLRTWAATGSPVFPFYMSIWKGAAEGWDVERSNLFQGMNSQYGGAAANPSNYLMAPARVSLAAQPENPELYDGVLGAAFLIGLPLLIWAIWRRKVSAEIWIAAGVAGVVYLFWLFSSPQLRYLLPIVPLFAVGIAAAGESISSDGGVRKAWKYSLIAASVLALLTSVAWFCQKAPLRVVFGGETRDEYLARNLDYYPYYQAINADTPSDAKVWLINMRRDTYNIERPVFSDYLFEDWTLRQMVWESRSVQELRAKTAAMGIQYVLTRHDFLFDYDRSTLVDDNKPRPENEAKLKIAREFILDPANTIKADSKFSLIKVFSE
ncbi:MAG: hypothetical protein AB7J13_02400 [Pyrinomonadaceae bacterium]